MTQGPHARALAWAALARLLLLFVGLTHLVLGVMDLAFPPELPFDTELKLYKDYEETHESERTISGLLSLGAAVLTLGLCFLLKRSPRKVWWGTAAVWTAAMAVGGGILHLVLDVSLHPGLGESVRPLGVARLATAAYAGHAIALIAVILAMVARPWQPAPDAIPSAFK